VFLAAGVGRACRGDASLWIDVPFRGAGEDGCGSAAMAMVMEYWEKKTGRTAQGQRMPAKSQSDGLIRPREGIPASAMKRLF